MRKHAKRALHPSERMPRRLLWKIRRQKVLKRAFAKLPNLTDKERRIIDIMTQRLEHKFLREPMTAMNSAAGTADEERYRDMICELFLLNDSGEDYIGDENKFDYWD